MRRAVFVPVVVALSLLAAIAVVRGDIPCDVVGTQPACEVAMRPGPIEDAIGLIDVDGVDSYPATGQLLLTTVAVDDGLGPLEWLRARTSSAVDVIPREQVFPPGLEPDEVSEQNAALMADSQLSATVAALSHLGFEVEGDGARIASVTPDAVTDALRVDDVVVAADGVTIGDSASAAAAVQALEPGDRIVFEVRRDGMLIEVPVVLGASPDDPDRAFVGVLLVTELELPVDVAIDAGPIGGPSAGLMFALSIIELLGEDDLTGGAVIAGTGTMDLDGTVGGVGGVAQKLVAATSTSRDDPVELFLVPRGNLDQARRAPVEREVTLVPIDRLDDALAVLEDLRAGRTPRDALLLRAGGGAVDAGG